MSNNLSSAQFGPGQQLPLLLTPEETAALNSSDFPGHKVANSRFMMREGDKKAAGYTTDPGAWEDYRHTSAGSSSKYLDSLKDKIDASGGIDEPVGVMGSNLIDGHHRAVVAMESKRLLPVNFWR